MIFVLLLTTFLAFLIVKQYLNARKLPPGPISLPLIGNIHQLVYYVWREKGVVPAFDLFRKVRIIN
ncbi:hypothetical protein CRE_09246 [Caenorhabditis remanei]|uniref:Uncharacterized protein n=1 Tax=Caenorhabditis remanei TaxID=31234 RepID=E3LHQ3_CAERE|nr:hypothetical protein CRE_09246 [Caenorhabditis remanei]